MSAFVVSRHHIDYLVSAANRVRPGLLWYGPYGEGERVCEMSPHDLGAALLTENIASVCYHYDRPEGMVRESPADYQFRPHINTDPVQALKAISCYEYQSCEHPGWATSNAKAFCEQLRHAMINLLPGYEEAEWEISASTNPPPISRSWARTA